MGEKRVLHMDFETFSDIDIGECGMYRYMESSVFEILLLSYALDDGPVRTVDFTVGETLPAEFRAALSDDNALISAWNSAFERNAMRTVWGDLCPTIERFDDPMLLAARCGLPLSLKDAGAAIGLREDEAKLRDGRALIRFFCQPCTPTTANGGRRRNLPKDSPGKWERFKEYNAQDVVAERAIRNKLRQWLPQPQEELKFWWLDQKINDEGIRVDLDLARQAVAMSNRRKEELTQEAKALTGLENPNSVAQAKRWLEEQEGKAFPSLNKKEIAGIEDELTSDKSKQFLALRSEAAKSSISKYEAMLRAATRDEHVKGCFQFYGAGHTGRFCLTGDHEVLTSSGWERLDQWNGGPIACWTPNGETVSFQKAKALQFPYEGLMYEYVDKRIAQISTPDHKMYVKRRFDKPWGVDTVENMASYRPSIPFFGYRTGPTVSERGGTELRVLVMVQADGHYTEDGTIKLGFTKLRKVERCKTLLRRAGIPFTYTVYKNSTPARHQFTIPNRVVPMWLRLFRTKTFGAWLFDEDPSVFFDELPNWDGYYAAKNSIQYATCNKQNADIIQAFAHMNGRAARLRTRDRTKEHPNWSTAYYVDIWLTPTNQHEIKAKPVKYNFNGTVYCAETSTGFFLVRRNGRVWVTGNSGRLVQLQNLPQNHLDTLDQCRRMVKNGDYENIAACYGSVTRPLSELIRTALLPEPGCKFLVADFSAIEARVIAWLAGEQWVLDAFTAGKDIYCETASQMFKVPVVKHGVNGELRAKGKIAVLACGFQGGVNALKAFGADKMGMSEEEMQNTVALYRKSNPKIAALWNDLERSAIRAVEQRGCVTAKCKRIQFEYERGILWMTLPSGRRIAYFKARIEDNPKRPGSPALSYQDGRANSNRIFTYSGRLAENATQSTARDLLRDAMLRLDAAGYDIRAHVHDEVIISEPIGGRSVEDAAAIMGAPCAWAPGLPLRADGYETPYYRKD